MGYLLGTDEAGYGPNLGPLVISATLWHVQGDPCDVELYARLAPGVVSSPPADTSVGHPLFIADSKTVYRNGQGLALLERGVLAALACLDRRPSTWRRLWEDLVSAAPATQWYADFDCEVPIDVKQNELRQATDRMQSALRAAAVELCGVRSRALFPRDFNDRVNHLGSKGAVLSQATMQLAAEMLADLPPEPVWIICDKHGGRNRYGPVLQQQFPDPLIEVRQESRARSVYRWSREGQPIEAHFCSGAEAHLPVALASMVSKYLRETAMRAFNRYWQDRVPGLRPTAGYPVDARRFRVDIAAEQRRLNIADHVLWRQR